MSDLSLVSSDTRRRLLQLVKRRGSLSIDDAMTALDLARTTVREHLLRLEEKDLVERFTKPSDGRGRPSHHFRMTPRGSALFPSRDGELARELIAFLQAEGADHLVLSFFETFWAERTRQVKDRLTEAEADTAEERLDVLRTILEEEGFMPEIDTDGDALVIRECNCPFPDTVKRTKLPCRLEADFYAALFDTEPERVSYIPEGRSACTYEFPADARLE